MDLLYGYVLALYRYHSGSSCFCICNVIVIMVLHSGQLIESCCLFVEKMNLFCFCCCILSYPMGIIVRCPMQDIRSIMRKIRPSIFSISPINIFFFSCYPCALIFRLPVLLMWLYIWYLPSGSSCCILSMSSCFGMNLCGYWHIFISPAFVLFRCQILVVI